MHPVIQRLAQFRLSDELDTKDVAYVLALHRTAVVGLITHRRLEAREIGATGRNKIRYRTTTEAVLRYLVKTTTADKAVLLEAIQGAFPKSSVLAAAAPRKPHAGVRHAAATHPDQMELFAPAPGSSGVEA